MQVSTSSTSRKVHDTHEEKTPSPAKERSTQESKTERVAASAIRCEAGAPSARLPAKQSAVVAAVKERLFMEGSGMGAPARSRTSGKVPFKGITVDTQGKAHIVSKKYNAFLEHRKRLTTALCKKMRQVGVKKTHIDTVRLRMGRASLQCGTPNFSYTIGCWLGGELLNALNQLVKEDESSFTINPEAYSHCRSFLIQLTGISMMSNVDRAAAKRREFLMRRFDMFINIFNAIKKVSPEQSAVHFIVSALNGFLLLLRKDYTFLRRKTFEMLREKGGVLAYFTPFEVAKESVLSALVVSKELVESITEKVATYSEDDQLQYHGLLEEIRYTEELLLKVSLDKIDELSEEEGIKHLKALMDSGRRISDCISEISSLSQEMWVAYYFHCNYISGIRGTVFDLYPNVGDRDPLFVMNAFNQYLIVSKMAKENVALTPPELPATDSEEVKERLDRFRVRSSQLVQKVEKQLNEFFLAYRTEWADQIKGIKGSALISHREMAKLIERSPGNFKATFRNQNLVERARAFKINGAIHHVDFKPLLRGALKLYKVSETVFRVIENFLSELPDEVQPEVRRRYIKFSRSFSNKYLMMLCSFGIIGSVSSSDPFEEEDSINKLLRIEGREEINYALLYKIYSVEALFTKDEVDSRGSETVEEESKGEEGGSKGKSTTSESPAQSSELSKSRESSRRFSGRYTGFRNALHHNMRQRYAMRQTRSEALSSLSWHLRGKTIRFRTLISALKKHGFVYTRTTGDHLIFTPLTYMRGESTKAIVTVPKRDEYSGSLLNSIRRDIGVLRS